MDGRTDPTAGRAKRARHADTRRQIAARRQETTDVVLVTPRPKLAAKINRVLQPTNLSVRHCDDPTEVLREPNLGAAVALIDADDPETGIAMAAAVALELEERGQAAVCVVLAEHLSTDEALELMRCGVCDVLSPRMRAEELRNRLAGAAERAAHRRRTNSDEVERLRKLCGKLEHARRELSGRVGGLCNELVSAYRDLSERVGEVSLASEVNSLFRQELDIEGLLRTLMETMLAKIGATNAAVFLPDSSGEYSVGAYINHDCPKASAETLLDQLSCTLPACVEGQPGMVELSTDADLEDALGEAAHWMAGSSLLAMPCDDDGECLGVLTVFREGDRGYSEEDRRAVAILTPLFAAQLARVIRVHHRHLPEAEWGFETGFDADDDYETGYDPGPNPGFGNHDFGADDEWRPDADDDYGMAA